MTRRRWALCGLTLLLAACGSDVGGSVPTASIPTESSGAVTTAAVTSVGSTAVGSTPSSSVDPSGVTMAEYTASDLPIAEPCSMRALPAGGQITFVAGGRLYATAADGTVECLADLEGRSPTWLMWSPDGDEVLVGPDVLLRADGTFSPTGYFADNTNVSWSSPTGKALIAPKAATGELIWRDAHDSADRIDVSFADEVTSAAYHPAGKHIVAAGIGRDGLGPGVFVASNRGADAQRIGSLEPDTNATDVAFDMSGDSVVFGHHHADGTSHLHRYLFSSATLVTLADLPAVDVADVAVSPVDEGDVAWTQTSSATSSAAHVLLGDATTDVEAKPAEGEYTSQPIGWLAGHHLLVASRPVGTPGTAPFELWEWSPSGMTKVVDGVSAAAPRTAHGPYNELTIIPGSGFG